VTLTFDDGYENMITNALPVLQADGLHGTFYIISGALDTAANPDPHYMTYAQLQTLYQDGNEIGSHTVLHEPLPQLDNDEAIQEVCQDRYALMNPPGLAAGSLGPITDMAYPNGEGIATDRPNTTTDPSAWTATTSEGASTTTIESILKACGFNSARTVQGLDDNSWAPDLKAVPLTAADQYDPATATVPAGTVANDPAGTTINDPFNLQTTPSIGTIDKASTAAQVEPWITSAETADASSNGWVSLTLHDICTIASPATCDSPDGYQMDTTQFKALAGWLQTQEVAGNIVVRTMAQVVGGTDAPAVAPATTSPTNEWSSVAGWTTTGFSTVTGTTLTPAVNSTFTDAANGGLWYNEPGGPPCYELDQSAVTALGAGTNASQYIKTVAVTGEPNGDTSGGQIITKGQAGIITLQDLGECSPILAAGTDYTVTANYQSTVPVFFDVFIRSDAGNWSYWTDDDVATTGAFPATTGAVWGKATWTLPATLPAGYDGISFGLDTQAAGTLTVDDYSLTG